MFYFLKSPHVQLFHLFPIQRKSETKGRRPLRKNNLNGHCPDRNQVLIDDNDDNDDNGDNFDDYGDENDQEPFKYDYLFG